VQEGSRLESVLRTFAADVPFVIAAEVRIGASRWPGIEVAPCLTRESHVAPDSSLRVLLGNVADLDVAIPDARWIDRHLAEELPDDWLDELVPAGVVDDDEALTVWRQRARLRYEDELRRRERRGVTGVEAAFDDVLMGRLGLRFVEHDSTRREHLLWSHLQVEAGQDVALTLDLDLQQVAERAVRIAWQQQSSRYDDPDERKKVEAAIAVLDAHTGDLLAYAGAPIVSAAARDLPGVVWQGNGALGSVVKSFLLLEQLQSEAMGRPHRPLADLADCNGKFVFGDTLLGCGDEHWSQGRDPVQALAESCNLFFYQVGIGLGPEGIARALRRFGLLEPAGPQDPFAACWQPSIPGFAAARPRADTAQTIVPRRAIGYGVEASPVHVARAYAALATGSLPTVGLRLSEPRPRVPFTDVVGELEVVREGLRAAVATGTARRLRTLEQLGVCGKTGTAQIRVTGQNNAWFAGYLPQPSLGGQQLCCCAVVYSVQDKVHGGDAAGQIVVDVLDAVRDDPTLRARYLPPGAGR
jgi:penicillin-binding protein 2